MPLEHVIVHVGLGFVIGWLVLIDLRILFGQTAERWTIVFLEMTFHLWREDLH
jgi:hypothetical protein